MKRRRRCYSLEMQSNKNQYMIKIEAPPAGDWYIIAFRSWTDPDSGKIKQQGLGVSCETVLDAEMFVELPSTTLLVDPRLEHKLQLNDTSDSAVIQFYVPDVYLMESSLVLSSSCSEDCNITVHVTAGDNLVNILLNSTQTSLFFKPYANSFHYITLRLLSGNMSNIIVRLINQVIFDQVTPVELTRKSFPEFFLFDYEHLYGNDTKPQPFNVTADILSVFNFKIGRVYDVGGTITLGFKLVDINEKYKNIVLIACISLGHYSNITSGGACERVHGITTADVYVNITGPAYIHVPFPEEGTWYVSMRAFCSEETTDSNICPCGQMCLRGDTACNTCDCLSRCPVQVESIVASSPCIEGRCNDHGKCMHYMSGGFVFSACHCTGGYRGFDCADDAYVLTHSGILLQLLILTFSNLTFVGSIYVAIRREYFTETLSYAAVMFFSTFYHACEAGEDVYGVCIMRLSVLQFCDFFNALLAIWMTLVAMAALRPQITAFCQVAGAIVLAMGAEMDRTALWVFLLPAVTGSAMIGLFWGYRCRRKQTIRYPSRPYRTIYFPAGLLLVSLGLVSYAFLQTRKNYYLVHSLWHICVAIGVILLLPKRQYMK
ncbi:Protein NGX6 [Harpegnathos saltator]|uniref:Protein NGX6 n=1 Tax=Harpegnathos saltator TaxID=610380 RepID=E2BBK0_HARSA|nr:Protein NGX6 [Harpegnathos saltator]